MIYIPRFNSQLEFIGKNQWSKPWKFEDKHKLLELEMMLKFHDQN